MPLNSYNDFCINSNFDTFKIYTGTGSKDIDNNFSKLSLSTTNKHTHQRSQSYGGGRTKSFFVENDIVSGSTLPVIATDEGYIFTPSANIIVDDYIKPKSTQTSRPYHIIEHINQLEALIHKLQKEKQISVSFKTVVDHSYQFVCILQISTTKEDCIIDAVSLRSQLYKLNIIFKNPDIVKIVFDGRLVVSLLYNLVGLELCNVFDILDTTNELNNNNSITPINVFSAIKSFCSSFTEPNLDLEKSNWSQRPISSEMCKYAQKETSLMIEAYLTIKYKEVSNKKEPVNNRK